MSRWELQHVHRFPTQAKSPYNPSFFQRLSLESGPDGDILSESEDVLDGACHLPEHGFEPPLDKLSSALPPNADIEPVQVYPEVHEQEPQTDVEQAKNGAPGRRPGSGCIHQPVARFDAESPAVLPVGLAGKDIDAGNSKCEVLHATAVPLPAVMPGYHVYLKCCLFLARAQGIGCGVALPALEQGSDTAAFTPGNTGDDEGQTPGFEVVDYIDGVKLPVKVEPACFETEIPLDSFDR